jgi:catechol-2,3-dioxygenase
MNEEVGVEKGQRRPGVLGVHSLDHFALTVPDLAEAAAFYTTFGLDVRPEGTGAAIYTMSAAS